MQLAHRRVHGFWCAHGARLESENGPGTFKHELVQQMREVHAEQEKGRTACSSPVLRRKMQDILSLQRRHIMQFEFCLDEFNLYLTALSIVSHNF